MSVDRALRFLGLGTGSIEPVAADERGAMRADALATALAASDGRPTIVVAQAGNMNGGAIDPLGQVCAAARAAGAWVHVDGAFGLWAAASPSRRAPRRAAPGTPTRGRPTRTSGSTSRSTAASCSCATASAPRGDLGDRRLHHAGRRRPARADRLDA